MIGRKARAQVLERCLSRWQEHLEVRASPLPPAVPSSAMRRLRGGNPVFPSSPVEQWLLPGPLEFVIGTAKPALLPHSPFVVPAPQLTALFGRRRTEFTAVGDDPAVPQGQRRIESLWIKAKAAMAARKLLGSFGQWRSNARSISWTRTRHALAIASEDIAFLYRERNGWVMASAWLARVGEAADLRAALVTWLHNATVLAARGMIAAEEEACAAAVERSQNLKALADNNTHLQKVRMTPPLSLLSPKGHRAIARLSANVSPVLRSDG